MSATASLHTADAVARSSTNRSLAGRVRQRVGSPLHTAFPVRVLSLREDLIVLKKSPSNRSVLPNQVQNAQKWGSQHPKQGSEKGLKWFFRRLGRFCRSCSENPHSPTDSALLCSETNRSGTS